MAEERSLKALADAVLGRDGSRDVPRDGASQQTEKKQGEVRQETLRLTEPLRDFETVRLGFTDILHYRAVYRGHLSDAERSRLRADANEGDTLARIIVNTIDGMVS